MDTFTRFYREFERPLLRFFWRATGRADLAADLTAETFASALESVDKFDPRLGREDQWLFGIARNVLGKSWRQGRVETSARLRLGLPHLVLDDELIASIERLGEADGEALMELARLPEKERDAVRARVIEEREYHEIAVELHCSEAVVRQRVSRGLRTLRARLGGAT
ncbi:MAG TPA: RNA polymerase sigma factor [Solirubrobacteraceae bacterium]|nr:RNA polymerase sigma factor [Solirubrobacteraceae bacterium]